MSRDSQANNYINAWTYTYYQCRPYGSFNDVIGATGVMCVRVGACVRVCACPSTSPILPHYETAT